MLGKLVVGFIVISALVAGAAIYYLQEYAYYGPVEASAPAAQIRLQPLDGALAEPMLMTSEFEGIDADSSPLRFRGCFLTPMTLPMLTENYLIYDHPTPLNAPSWFSCFNADQIAADGDRLAFAILLNNHTVPGREAVAALDDIVGVLLGR